MSPCFFHDTDNASKDRRLFELVEQAYGSSERVIIFASTIGRADALDRTLWICRQESFIPHKIWSGDKSESSLPVVIVTGEMNPICAQILIADGHCGIDFALGFGTIHEFVDRSSPQMQEACRERFRAYRSRQITPEYLK